MRIEKLYQNTRLSASAIDKLREYLSSQQSRSLGEPWGHKVARYVLQYGPDESLTCNAFAEVEAVLQDRGDTSSHATLFESRTGRRIEIDTRNPTRITVVADNKGRTIPFLQEIERRLELTALPRRVFVSHGRSDLWLRVQRFIEKDPHLDLEVVELAEQPSKGMTVPEKLRYESGGCSYAVVVMTGDDITEDEIRVRENVMHEIGFFQGRYGNDRVCLLYERGVNIPSNLSGLVYLPFDNGQVEVTFLELQKELRAAFPTA